MVHGMVIDICEERGTYMFNELFNHMDIHKFTRVDVGRDGIKV